MDKDTEKKVNTKPEDNSDAKQKNDGGSSDTTKKTGRTKKVSFVGGSQRRRGRRTGRSPRAKSDMEQTMINIRRVTRVVAGGRRFSFSVAMVVGDKKGKVGVGLGKAADTAAAIEKAVKQANKNLASLRLTKNSSIPKEVQAKFNSAVVYLKPAPGRGLTAGSSLRMVLEKAGITDVNAKILSRSKNKYNIALATIKALKKVS